MLCDFEMVYVRGTQPRYLRIVICNDIQYFWGGMMPGSCEKNVDSYLVVLPIHSHWMLQIRLEEAGGQHMANCESSLI